jgi:hypothetical protein
MAGARAAAARARAAVRAGAATVLPQEGMVAARVAAPARAVRAEEQEAFSGTRRHRELNKPHRSKSQSHLVVYGHNPRHPESWAHQGTSWSSPTECRRTTSRCPRLPHQSHRYTHTWIEGRRPAQRRSPRRCGCLRDRRREPGTRRAQPPTSGRLICKQMARARAAAARARAATVRAGAATVLPQEGMVAARVAAPAPVETRPPGTQRPCLGLHCHHMECRST